MGPEMNGCEIAPGLARGSGAAAQGNRITERAHPGIRAADGENRQRELPANRTTQTGERGRNANRADVYADPGRSTSLRKESRGRLFSAVASWAQGRGFILSAGQPIGMRRSNAVPGTALNH